MNMRNWLLTLAFGLCSGAFAQHTTVFESPVMGWSSWNTYRVHINDTLIIRQADAMVQKGLKDVGYSYVNVDDGFFGWRDEKGVMQTHPERFPNGLKGVADHIHSLGLKAGIYSDAGSNTCGSIWDKDMNGIGSGLYGHEYQDATLYFKEWGFDFIKIDYCGAGQELNLEEEKRYTEIRQAIDNLGCGHVSINICRWAFPGTWAGNLARSWRISADIRPEWGSVKYIIGKNLYLSAYAGEGHYNDMDMLEIGRGLKPEEEEVHFGMWCIMSSPLLIGCDLTTIPEASLKLLKNKELIALNQDPLGLQAYVVQHENEGYVLVKDIERKRGNVRAVALYNPSDTICNFTVPMDMLELGGRVKARDLVKQQNLPEIKEGVLHRKLPPHSVLILRMESEKRLEPAVYEAEWAYLPCFNDLGKTPKSIVYAPLHEASGGMKVSYLGGRKENFAEWKEVYSEQGGEYEMTIRYVPKADRKLEVCVNHEKAILLDSLSADETQKIASVTVPVYLKAGNNKVRMGSSFCWAPDIDCFILKKVKE
ncbi:alpha-galactosidase D [Phocaeicola sartorii]|uniref:alpha-galactosidase D n=1 Tax=Phocaeicola sartorii TaxID=671267 RepID=UPI00266FB4A2|nr:alpha-galactosidase [Phocaeicola sartorii]